MAIGHSGGVLRQLHQLFGPGTVSGLAEGQLLRRFVDRRDEAAFEALVTRHGPMVLGVCRRVLADPHDVDDAFQATFLVLVKKAATIRDGDRLGPWLFGVAYRVAARARANAARRRAREMPGVEEAAVGAIDVAERRELCGVLDEELNRLPGKYRAPLVLCYLQGQTHEEAAAQLHWPVGTVRSRMAKGRELLRGRLSRRGSAWSAGALAGALTSEAASAAVPPALLETTVRAAIHVAAGGTIAAGVVSVGVAELTRGALRTMVWSQIKTIAAAGLLLVAATGGVGVLGRQIGGATPAPDERSPQRSEGGRVDVNRLKQRERELLYELSMVRAQLALEQRDRLAGGIPVVPPLEARDPKPAPPVPAPRASDPRIDPTRPGPSGLGAVVRLQSRPSTYKSETMIATPSPVGGRILAYSVETGRWEGYQVPEGVKATTAMSEDVLAPILEGPEVTEIAAFVAETGRWYPQTLREPVSGQVVPKVGRNMVAYGVGRFVYAFSPTSGKWGILELEKGAQAVPAITRMYTTVEHRDRLHVYSGKTGRWESIPLKVGEGPRPTPRDDQSRVRPAERGGLVTLAYDVAVLLPESPMLDDYQPLINLITTTVAPGTWKVREDDPRVGSITPFFLNTSLIVRHDNAAHEQVVARLQQLRRVLGRKE